MDVDPISLVSSISTRLRERAERRMAELSHSQAGITPTQLGDVKVLIEIADIIDEAISYEGMDQD